MINNNNGKIIKLTKMRKPLLLVLSSVFALFNLFAGNSDWTDRPHTGKPLAHWTFSKDRFYRLHVSPLSVTDDLAKAQARTMVRNVSAKSQKTAVQWILKDAEG
jgi:hypothetical protein